VPTVPHNSERLEVRPVTVTELEMLSPSWVSAAREPSSPVRLARAGPDTAAVLSRACYVRVGADWSWVDRLSWSDQRWQDWVSRPGHELWTLTVDDEPEPAGYFELDQQDDGAVEVAYFGLVPGYEGRGLGGWLLTCALRRAWELPATRRVWLHTCELDSPAALPNYVARGLRVRTTRLEERFVVTSNG
jgi:RimJ/RimL family protein N-acetyltransferase